MDATSPALLPTDVIQSSDPDIVALAAGIARNGTPDQRARRLFEWVRDEIAYDYEPDLSGRPDWAAKRTLRRRQGFCQQKAVALTTLARAVGIPALLSFQTIRDRQLPSHLRDRIPGGRLEWHGLVSVHLGTGWRRIDPTLDAERCDRYGFRLVGFDDQPEALLPGNRLDGTAHFEILAELGEFSDLPEQAVAYILTAREQLTDG